MKIIKIQSMLLLILLCTGCKEWIDVQPSDRLEEEQLFENRAGYLKALNGVYIEMANASMYGQFMSAGQLDVMGQYYYAVNSLNPFYEYMIYDYTDSGPKAGFDAVWRKTFSAIYNLNVLIENCGDGPSSKLPKDYYNLIKGEALALRAFLHFDMLRLFGPIYNEANKDLKALPYYMDSSRKISPLYSSAEVLQRIAVDIQQAKELLQESDPILTTGLGNTAGTNGDNTFSYRQYRFNYYALQAFHARVLLWMGDKENAGKIARQTIAAVQQAGKEIFPFVTAASVNNNVAPDRIFASEVLFSIYKLNRVSMYNTLFSPTIMVANRLNTNAGNADKTRTNAMYDDKNDYRFKIWEDVPYFNLTLVTNQKYYDYINSPGQYMIPLLRVGELYLIAAECTADINEAKNYLNTLRLKRNTFNLAPTDEVTLKPFIASEYRRELFGEGQQFFFYKRNAYTEVPNNAVLSGNKAMPLNNYRVPLPDSEISVRSNP